MALAAVAVTLSACGSWQGIAGVPLPGGPGTRSSHVTVYVQMPDTLALNVNSRVRVADVYVGRIRGIELINWVATVTVDLEPDVMLPVNASATIGQTTLLGTQHLELTPPARPSPTPLRDGDTIPLPRATAFPTTERTLAAISTILTGGGIHNLETIQTEVNAALTGRADRIREFLGRLDTFTAELDRQRADVTRAIDSTNDLLSIMANRASTLDTVLTQIPPLVEYFADSRDSIGEAITALGRLSAAATSSLKGINDDIHANLESLRRPLRELARSAPLLVETLSFLVTNPFPIDNIGKVVRGDYINASITVDLTLSALDNGWLSGTALSGSLRALEQAWGRNPSEMIPDVRFTPNPHNAPGGPLVERGE
ncbi:MCE family protein [Mycolicibacterium hippocampi]|uniref:Mammalian cell entry protein n=1 Tax=Mycolicibacterium hippocampi TaxID=659824 RepID=A0A7I9ZP34_9MYCO|nr:MCE family protein [Mycolicibacterium hippocampi]GFH02609.1 mammalian cell entry protein [Mycolicibacterium hippocampi]